jgi:hypothetical protein
MDLDLLKYPIGKFDAEKEYTFEDRIDAINVLRELPQVLYNIAQKFNTDQLLDTAYRPEGWTARQVFHHLVDSHINLFVRLKSSLDVNNTDIKGYNEEIWANMADAKEPIEPALKIIDGLHSKLVVLFENMSIEDYDRTYYHPGYQRTYTLKNVLQLYKWHSLHHAEHLKIVLRNA